VTPTRLDHLCDVGWTYGLLSEVEGADRRDGRVHGQGRGSGRLCGTAVWSSYPRTRGVIRLTDGGQVLVELRGLSSLQDGSGVHVMLFETAAPTHLCLNDVLAVGEGVVDVERSRPSMRYDECGVELPLAHLHG
jgi:hypothetical protein